MSSPIPSTSRASLFRRIGVLAYTTRSREYLRRILRSFGLSPRVFASAEELSATGGEAMSLDMLLLGDGRYGESFSRLVMPDILATVGPDVPVLYAPLRVHERVPSRANDGLVVASPHCFGELYEVVSAFLKSHGFEGPGLPLSWPRYSFQPHAGTVRVMEREVRMNVIQFDVALEFFFNEGKVLTENWLKCMLPKSQRWTGPLLADGLATTVEEVRVALQLNGSNGWVLADLAGSRYSLSRSAHADSNIGRRRASPGTAKPSKSLSQLLDPSGSGSGNAASYAHSQLSS